MSVTHWRGSVPHLQPTTKLKPVLFLVGLILLITAGMMLLPMSVDLYYGSEDWRAFAASCALSAVIGSILTYTSRKSPNTGLTLRQAFVLTPLTWLSVAMISAMPFFFAEYGSVSGNFSNAFFEAVSGITTTGVFPRVYDDRLLDDEVIGSVVAFFTVFFLCFFVLTVLLMAFGLDFLTSASGAATALANVGPGLGEIIGPTNNFAPLPDGAKWLLSLGMLLGRLELFTVLILFVPRFWR